MNSQDDQTQSSTPGSDSGMNNCSMEQAFNHCKSNNVDFETFKATIVNRIKFVVS